MHLLAMVALYTTAIAFTTIVWQLVNIWVPDALQQYFSESGARQLIRSSLAFLVVLFPVYVWTTWTLHKSYREDDSKQNLKVRKWLIYFTMFVAGLIIIFSTVALVMSLLDGELTLRFLLKMLSVFFVTGSIFGYYKWELNKFEIK